MIRIIKKIQFFFLFLAISVLNAHMIIPHDHHMADSDACHDKSPVSKNGNNRHTGFPHHCHAFNDLASEKAIAYQIIKQVLTRDFLPGSVHSAGVSNVQLSWIRIVDVRNKPVINYLQELSSLRAPPISG